MRWHAMHFFFFGIFYKASSYVGETMLSPTHMFSVRILLGMDTFGNTAVYESLTMDPTQATVFLSLSTKKQFLTRYK